VEKRGITRYKYLRARISISFLHPKATGRRCSLPSLAGSEKEGGGPDVAGLMKRRTIFGPRDPEEPDRLGPLLVFGSCHNRDTLIRPGPVLGRWRGEGSVEGPPRARAIDFCSLRTGSANCGGRRRTPRVSCRASPSPLSDLLTCLPVLPFFSRLSWDLEVDVRPVVRERH